MEKVNLVLGSFDAFSGSSRERIEDFLQNPGINLAYGPALWEFPGKYWDMPVLLLYNSYTYNFVGVRQIFKYFIY